MLIILKMRTLLTTTYRGYPDTMSNRKRVLAHSAIYCGLIMKKALSIHKQHKTSKHNTVIASYIVDIKITIQLNMVSSVSNILRSLSH